MHTLLQFQVVIMTFCWANQLGSYLVILADFPTHNYVDYARLHWLGLVTKAFHVTSDSCTLEIKEWVAMN